MKKKQKKMEFIIRFIGSKKTIIYWLKIKHLKSLINIKEIGKITKKMVLEFKFIRVEIGMKESGKIIREMEREHYGLWIREENSRGNILENGEII